MTLSVGAMYALPFSMCAHVAKEDLLKYECSDRIILSFKIASDYLFGLQNILSVYNMRDEFVTGSVYKIVEATGKEEMCIYLPSWMYWKYDFTGPLKLSHEIKQGWTAFQIRPHRATFQNTEKFLQQLYTALNAYSTLSQDTRVPLCVEGTLEYIQINRAFPTSVQICTLSACGSLDLQIFPSLDQCVLGEKTIPFLYSCPSGAERHPDAFLGKANVLGGMRAPTSTPATEAIEAARRRLTKR